MEKEGFSIQHLRSFLNREGFSIQHLRSFLNREGFSIQHLRSFLNREGFSIQHLRSFLNREDISKQKIRAFLEKTGSFMSANGEKPSKRPSVSSAVKVLVQPVVIKPNNRVFEAVGTGRARLSVLIYPAVSEEVLEVLFKAQNKVSKGDVLLRALIIVKKS